MMQVKLSHHSKKIQGHFKLCSHHIVGQIFCTLVATHRMIDREKNQQSLTYSGQTFTG